MSTRKFGTVWTLPAAADYSTKRWFLMTHNSSDQVELATTLGEKILGPLLNDPTATQHGTVQLDGIGEVKLGGTVAIGDNLTTDANGAAVATTTTGHWVFGRALDAGVVGDVISVNLEKTGELA